RARLEHPASPRRARGKDRNQPSGMHAAGRLTTAADARSARMVNVAKARTIQVSCRSELVHHTADDEQNAVNDLCATCERRTRASGCRKAAKPRSYGRGGRFDNRRMRLTLPESSTTERR